MKIVQLISRRQLRGAEVFAAELADGLAARHHEVWLVGLGRPADPDDMAAGLARRIDLGGRLGPGISPGLLRSITRVNRDLQPDIVQANGFASLKYAAVAQKWTHSDWLLVYRNISIAGRWLRSPVQRMWGRWLLRSVAMVTSVSDQSRRDFQRQYRISDARIATVRRGIPIPETFDKSYARQRLCQLASSNENAHSVEAVFTPGGRSSSRAETSCKTGSAGASPSQDSVMEPILVHVGSFTPEKNHTGLLDAFAIVRERFPNATLVLFGDGPLRTEIEQCVQRRSLDGSVAVAGSRDDAAELAAGADLLLLPSHVEGVPGVVLEAAARGVPAVATDVGGVSEAIVGGNTGVLVAPGDADVFGRAAVHLLEQPPVLRRMGQAAREHVTVHFGLDRAVSRFAGLYERILAVGNQITNHRDQNAQ